jgi:RHS repeat-associated protein
VNGVTASAGYGQGSTDASVASALASAVNNDGSMPVTASLSSATVTLTSKGIGTGANYSLGTSCTYTHTYWTFCSFTGSLSGSAMTGGSDVTDYDYGTVSAVINGQSVSADYGQNDSDSTVAANLATAINNNSSYATASASGSSLAITARGTGAGTNYSLSASSATGDSGQFSSPSFSASASGSSLTGGQNGQGSGAYSVTGITYAPDGDVTGANDSVNGQWQYEYDPLNRLVEACETNCASPTNAAGYVYDRFGNRWQENALAGTIWSSAQLTFDANNHIVGASYDAAGDLLGDAAGHSYAYNANHRIVSADSGNIQYVYNAFGQRVEKSVGGAAKYYLYDPAGRAVTVLEGANGNWVRGEIFAGGRHIATYLNGATGTTYFDYSDWLGTLRMSATLAGYEQSECTSGPFGEGLNCSSPTPLQFTGQQHDSETGLDHFLARYYTSTWGVWMTPDWSRSPTGVPYATFSDPQSLDLYNYTLGNPETNTDPNGHWCFIGVGTTCPPSRTRSSGVGGSGPALSGPSWFARCQANLFCGAALDAGIIPITYFSGTPGKGGEAPPDGPPPVPVPGCPTCGWKWNANPKNPRGGTWGPEGWKGPHPPSGSWDPSGHWDIDNGRGKRQRYDPNGDPITPDQAHSRNTNAHPQGGLLGTVGAIIKELIQGLPSPPTVPEPLPEVPVPIG